MKYMGSKAKLAKLILPIILKNHKPQNYYVEPFCGGCNCIDKVPFPLRIANDSNKYLISLFNGLLQGLQPPTQLTLESYTAARLEYKAGTNIAFSDFEIAYLGFLCSFRGKFFAGFNGDAKYERRYIAENINNITKQLQYLKGIEFNCCAYDAFNYPPNSTIYCDPPYQDTTKYKTTFDNSQFWEFVRNTSQHHTIYVSEYNAPDDFTCVFQHNTISTMSCTTSAKPAIEKLFTYNNATTKPLTLFT